MVSSFPTTVCTQVKGWVGVVEGIAVAGTMDGSGVVDGKVDGIGVGTSAVGGGELMGASMGGKVPGTILSWSSSSS